MYSRSRMMNAEERYAGNVPPVYGGNRFYGGGEREISTQDVRVATFEEGIPVEYEAPPKASAVRTALSDEQTEMCGVCQNDTPDTKSPDQPKESESRSDRLLSLFADREELLLLGLLILLLCEQERSPDVIVILLLLLAIR